MGYKLPLLAERSLKEGRAVRAYAVSQFEREIQKHTATTKKGVTCSKRCDHCCHHPISLSLLEGASLYLWLVDNFVWTPQRKEQFLKHSDTVWGLSPEVWMLSMIPCPLLGDHLCKAYEGRPAVCRATVSTGDPYYCHPHRFGSEVTGLLPRHSFYNAMVDAETKLLYRHGQVHIQLPLSTAVLYGEKVCKGEMALEDSGFNMALGYRKLDATT